MDVVVLRLAQPKQKHQIIARVTLPVTRAVSHTEGDKRYIFIFIERICRLSALYCSESRLALCRGVLYAISEMKITSRTTRLGLSCVVLLSFMFLTNPLRMPVYALIIPFVLVGVLIYTTIGVLYELFTRRKETGRRVKLLSVLASVGLTLLLCLQSLGELKSIDALAVLGVMAITYFYLSRGLTHR